MTLAIVIIMLLVYVLIASEHLTRINKATIAMFAGVLGWILYMCVGTDFVNRMHGEEFQEFLGSMPYSVHAAKQFIASHVFIRHSAFICNIVLYLLSTMIIIELLSQNGCFDFITNLLRTRNTNHIVTITVLLTFLLSTEIDNLTTAVLMLTIMRRLVSNERQRLYLGSCIVIAACCGGCFTVIGDVTSLMVWTKGAVTATAFSGALIVPALVATIIPTMLIRRSLPSTIDLYRRTIVFRGDDSHMPLWQQITLLFFGLGGLWFVPSFHRITLLPPFLGALCVLGVIWVLNELFNYRSLRTEQPLQLPGSDRKLQYEVLQVIMYFIGVSLIVSVMIEIGAMEAAAKWLDAYIHDIYVLATALACLSSVMDNVCLVMSGINIYDVLPASTDAYYNVFMQNGSYWHLVMLAGCVGGCLLPIGNTAGYALMKCEDCSVWWYIRHISGKVLLGLIASLATYFLMAQFVF